MAGCAVYTGSKEYGPALQRSGSRPDSISPNRISQEVAALPAPRPGESSKPGDPQGPPAVRKRGSRAPVVIFAVLGTTAVILVLVLVAALLPSPPMGATSRATYNLHQSMGLSFPDCAVVSVAWHDLDGDRVGFAVASASEAAYASDCGGPVNSPNDTCPAAVCPPRQASARGGPIEYETATQGNFFFTATQPGYTFYADNPNSSVISNDTVQFNVSYATPLVARALAAPWLLALIGVGVAAVLTATAILVTRRRT